MGDVRPSTPGTDSDLAPDAGPSVPSAPTPLEQRFADTCADLARTLRCIEGVSAQAARVLESGGTPADLLALLGAFDRLVTDAGAHGLALGSMGQCFDCAGSA